MTIDWPEELPALFDWPFVLQQANKHGLIPLLHRFVTHRKLHVPPEITGRIEKQTRQLAIANLLQTQELLGLLKKFEAASIEVMPFKGPLLGHYLFGNLALRTFSDLDILIHKADFQRVKTLMEANGYNPFRRLSDIEEQKFVETQMGFEFVRHDERCVVEVHWSFLNKVHAFRMKPAEVWLHKTSINLNGQRVRMFSPAHLLVYLCAHGAKSFWTRIRWISDVAELIKKHDNVEFWQHVQQIAKESHSERIVYLGLNLAHTLLGAPLPERIQSCIDRDTKIGELSAYVKDTLFKTEAGDDLSLKNVSFHLAMRERFIDRLPYMKHLLRLWLSPSAKDKAMVELPNRLAFLYIFLKPIRLVRDRLG